MHCCIQLAEKELSKTIEIASRINKESLLKSLEELKKNDSNNLDYYDRFEKKINCV